MFKKLQKMLNVGNFVILQYKQMFIKNYLLRITSLLISPSYFFKF